MSTHRLTMLVGLFNLETSFAPESPDTRSEVFDLLE